MRAILVAVTTINDQYDINYSLDEVFITNNITSVICINKNRKIEEICNFYKANLISI